VTKRKIDKKEKRSKLKTIPVPFAPGEIKGNININTNTPPKPSKEQIIDTAFRFHSQGNISEAAKYYQYFVSQGFSDVGVFSNYGVILKNLGKLEEAEIVTRKAIKIDSSLAHAHYNLGTILKDLGKLEEAKLETQQAINIRPDFFKAYFTLGLIFKDLGKLEEAKIATQKAIDINPKLADAYSNLGIILKDLGKLEEAEITTQKAIDINPDLAEAYSNLASILKDLGKLKEAEIPLRKAIELKPEIAESYSNLGGILIALGKSKEAEIPLRKAIELKPDLVNTHWNLYLLANNIHDAEKNLNQCLKIDKNFLDAKTHLSALKLHQGDHLLSTKVLESTNKYNPSLSSLKWIKSLSNIPELFFQRWELFDSMLEKCIKNRPFYEFGVWRGESFKYLIKKLKRGYGFDTFEGLPESWNNHRKGAFSNKGIIPNIDGGTFIKGMFQDTLPTFFSKPRAMASIINFDADLYSSTICALNYSKNIIDKDTIIIFDEFIIHQNWEKDEYKALNEFCSNNNLKYEVLAISYKTGQAAFKLTGFK